jgi:AcrR family transcriptional regulator
MTTRAASVEATRERILEAACNAFLNSWYEEVTLRDVAAAADVALQTVVNHFGTKEALYGAAVERIDERIKAGRYEVEPGDVEGAVAALVDDYDQTGDFILRALAEEGRLAVVRPGLARGRRAHQDWVEHIFAAALMRTRGAARERRVAQLVAVTDVYTWKLLRRDREMSREQTILAIRELVEALHTSAEGEACDDGVADDHLGRRRHDSAVAERGPRARRARPPSASSR